MSEPTPVFDANLHPEGLSARDLESMRLFGVTHAVVAAHHFPQPTARALLEHFDDIVERQLPRLERAGIRGYAALGAHPRSLPRRGLFEVLGALPGYFRGGRVVGVGAVGLALGGEAEEEAFLEQVTLARRLKLPVWVYTPPGSKEALARRAAVLIKQVGISPARVLVDGAAGRTLRTTLGLGHHAALTVHPDALSAEAALGWIRKLGATRLVLSTGAGTGASDILALPRLVRLMERAKLSDRLVGHVAFENLLAFLR